MESIENIGVISWVTDKEMAFIATVALSYSFAFVLFRKVIMPMFHFYREFPVRHQLEWIMRIVATFNGSVCSVIGTAGLFGFVDVQWYRVSNCMMIGYFIYDTLGNIYYFSVLHKSYILFHHVVSLVISLLLTVGHVSCISLLGCWCLLPDPVDHLLWFFHRLHIGDAWRKTVGHLNTVHYVFNRVIFCGYYQWLWTFTHPEVVSHALFPFHASIMVLCVVFFGMNLYVSYQRIFKKKHPLAPTPVIKMRPVGAAKAT